MILDLTRDFANAVSLALTPTTIYICMLCVSMFRFAAVRALFSKYRKSVQWFSLGVAISFLGSTMDNIYWGAAWSAGFARWPIREFLFDNGVFSNVPFRQLGDSLGGYCHLICGIHWLETFEVEDEAKFKSEVRNLHRKIFLSMVFGVFYVALLYYLRFD